MDNFLVKLLKWYVYVVCFNIVLNKWNKDLILLSLMISGLLALLELIEGCLIRKVVEHLMEGVTGVKCKIDDKICFYSLLVPTLALLVLQFVSCWYMFTTKKLWCVVGLVYCLVLIDITGKSFQHNAEQLAALKQLIPTVKEDLSEAEDPVTSEGDGKEVSKEPSVEEKRK